MEYKSKLSQSVFEYMNRKIIVLSKILMSSNQKPFVNLNLLYPFIYIFMIRS